MCTTVTNLEPSIRATYSLAAHVRQDSLCCPVVYNRQYLKVIPQEVLDRDYGCGDPSQFVRTGETVLDLGSGGGKICFIAAQVVGQTGRVIGVDMTDDMLELARRSKPLVAKEIGYDNIDFRKGMIQDLRLDLADTEAFLARHPIATLADLQGFEAHQQRQRQQRPLIADESVDVIVSNCVLNLVAPADKARMFTEMFRVLRTGGRVAISDIVSDEDVPADLRNDPDLWSGCISGALREDEFLEAFERAGFFGIHLVKRDSKPWRTVRGIEFRSVTVTAHKGKQGPCLEANQAVVYAGPWKQVVDDDGHILLRGKRMAVCDKTFRIMTSPQGPYAQDIYGIEPIAEVPADQIKPFVCKGISLRDARQTKGQDYAATTEAADSCTTDGCC